MQPRRAIFFPELDRRVTYGLRPDIQHRPSIDIPSTDEPDYYALELTGIEPNEFLTRAFGGQND